MSIPHIPILKAVNVTLCAGIKQCFKLTVACWLQSSNDYVQVCIYGYLNNETLACQNKFRDKNNWKVLTWTCLFKLTKICFIFFCVWDYHHSHRAMISITENTSMFCQFPWEPCDLWPSVCVMTITSSSSCWLLQRQTGCRAIYW